MLILEGCDLIGKSTAFKVLKEYISIQDRDLDFTNAITDKDYDLEKLNKTLLNHPNDLFVILYTSNLEWFDLRLPRRESPDQYDVKCREYNQQYIEALRFLDYHPNIIGLDVYGMTPLEKISQVFKIHLGYVHKGLE